MKLRKIVVFALMFSMLISATAFAQEKEVVLDEGKASNIGKEIKSMEEYASSDFDKVKMNKFSPFSISGTGDTYEPNSLPAFATVGRYNKVTYATIHETNDNDWYKFEVTNAANEMTFILTNLPNDYDMYIVKYNSNNEMTEMYYDTQLGTASEMMTGCLSTGTYYVVVQNGGTNYSDNTYRLYMGDSYRTGSYGYVSAGFSANFGNVPVGNMTPVSRGWYSFNLANKTTIPDGAIVKEFILTADGNGAWWGGFYKTLAANGQGYRLSDKLGGIDLMYSGDNEYWVKQEWLIGGYLTASSNFVWTPNVYVLYKYPVTIANLNFI